MRECLEQVSIGRYPRQRKYRESGAHALVYWRGSESTPAGASRAGESTPASTTRRRGGAKWGERVAPAFARVALASRANVGRVVTKVGATRHQKWRDSSPKWRDSAPKLQTLSQTRPKRGAIGSRPAPGTPSGKRSARTHRTVSVGCMPDEGAVPTAHAVAAGGNGGPGLRLRK